MIQFSGDRTKEGLLEVRSAVLAWADSAGRGADCRVSRCLCCPAAHQPLRRLPPPKHVQFVNKKRTTQPAKPAEEEDEVEEEEEETAAEKAAAEKAEREGTDKPKDDKKAEHEEL